MIPVLARSEQFTQRGQHDNQTCPDTLAQVVQLRDDLRTGELSLAVFAADLHDVVMQKGRRPVYEDPAQFFALTYPTYNLRELVKDVCVRLGGQK